MAKSKNSSPWWKTLHSKRETGFTNSSPNGRIGGRFSTTVSCAENSRAGRDEKQCLWIFNHSSEAAPSSLPIMPLKEKICQHWVNTVVWCGCGLEVEGDISLRPSVFTPLIPEKKFTSVRKVLGDLASSQTCSVYRSPLPQPHGGAANSWECLARGLCMCAPR